MKNRNANCGAVVFGAAAMALAAALVTPLHAQSLAARIDGAPRNAEVQFSFPTRAGVCGDGDRIIARRGTHGPDDISVMEMQSDGYSSFNMSTRNRSSDLLRNCVAGPAHVTLSRDNGDVARVRVTVAGEPRANTTDLGTTTSAEAAQYLLRLAEDAPKNVADRALFTATLGDATSEIATGLIAITHKQSIVRDTRSSAVYWLGQSTDPRALPRLKEILADTNENESVRESSIFALTLQKSPETIDLLLNTARHASESKLRQNAIFWLGQMAGEKATAGLSSVLGDDSEEIEVRNAAIYAVSQQNTPASVDLLMHVAKTSKEPELRRTAMYWLGQHANDPRVLKMFEDILVDK